jgi:mono/diheme cytochrome c family protein
MASLHHHAAVLLTFGLLAGCGGDRTRARTGTDTAGAAAVTPDSAAMAMKDTAAAPVHDTTAPTDTARRPSAVAPAPKPATKTASADTGARHRAPAKPKPVAAAESTKPAPPAPAPAAQPPAQQPAPQQAPQQDTTQQEAPLRDAYHQAPRDTVDQATYDGWKQFNLNCARCHGEDALGTTIAPHLIVSLKPDGPINTKELFVQTVCAGRPEKGMPAWCALGLGMDKINDIYLYVKGRSDAKLAPGRPAVKSGG